MANLEHIKGLDELQSFLDQVTPKIEANIMRGALRAGMNVVKPAAQANIHSVSGLLAKGLKVSANRRGHVVTAKLKATGPHAQVAHLVEFSTRPHNISAKFSGWLSFANIFRKVVQHPGTKPRPFMRPALDSQASAAVVATGEYIKSRLTKEGLNATHVAVEGDE